MAESDSKSSSDETDRLDQNDDLGSGRSYECAFCKRGFTTAQALGGHMNIHRKDRVKPIRPNYTADDHHHNHNPVISSKLVDDNYASFRSFLAIQSYPPVHFARAPDHQVHLDYHHTCTTLGNTTGPKPSQDQYNSQDHDPNYYDLLRGNWKGSTLSLGIGMEQEDDHDHHEYHHDKEKISGGLHREDHVEVDLELRLGYDP